MFKLIRSKKDARLYFRFIVQENLDMSLGELKTKLIQLGYIEHIEGDRYIELKKLNRTEVLDKLKELK